MSTLLIYIQILIGKRTDTGEYCGPGGHIEPHETPAQAAIRETREEFGIVPSELFQIGDNIYICYDYEGEPQCVSDEMIEPQWIEITKLLFAPAYRNNLFEPFKESLYILCNAPET